MMLLYLHSMQRKLVLLSQILQFTGHTSVGCIALDI